MIKADKKGKNYFKHFDDAFEILKNLFFQDKFQLYVKYIFSFFLKKKLEELSVSKMLIQAW